MPDLLMAHRSGCPPAGATSSKDWRYNGLDVSVPYNLEAPELIRVAAHGSVLSGAL